MDDDLSKGEVVTMLLDMLTETTARNLRLPIPPMAMAEITAQVLHDETAAMPMTPDDKLDLMSCLVGLAVVRLAVASVATRS